MGSKNYINDQNNVYTHCTMYIIIHNFVYNGKCDSVYATLETAQKKENYREKS